MLHPILEKLSYANGSVINFMISNLQQSRMRYLNKTLPTFDSVPEGSAVMLNLEPAADETESLMPGVRVGTELWELGYAMDFCAARETRLFLHYDPFYLCQMRLTENMEECEAFLHNVAAVTRESGQSPTLVNTQMDSMETTSRLWRGIADTYYIDSAQPVANINIKAPKPSRMRKVESLMIRMPYFDPTNWHAVKKETMLTQVALYNAKTSLGIARRMVALPWGIIPSIRASQIRLPNPQP